MCLPSAISLLTYSFGCISSVIFMKMFDRIGWNCRIGALDEKRNKQKIFPGSPDMNDCAFFPSQLLYCSLQSLQQLKFKLSMVISKKKHSYKQKIDLSEIDKIEVFPKLFIDTYFGLYLSAQYLSQHFSYTVGSKPASIIQIVYNRDNHAVKKCFIHNFYLMDEKKEQKVGICSKQTIEEMTRRKKNVNKTTFAMYKRCTKKKKHEIV